MAEHLHGWKSIAAHFGRERSTVMRWASERGLPIHRIPGGKKGGVYAVVSELNEWAARADAGVPDSAILSDGICDGPTTDAPLAQLPVEAATERPRATNTAVPDKSRRRWMWLAPLMLVCVVAATVLALYGNPFSARAEENPLPRDPQAAQLYMQARDDWARREPEALARSIRNLMQVTEIEPDFAPAYAALADSFLLSREFGSLGDDTAFPKAIDAANIAVRLDPNLAGAHRAIGFSRYWWDHDNAAAGEAFRKALTLDPRNAQTHFWYGNVLSDNGEHQAGLRELETARLLQPGSVAIRTDFAWALWSAGREKEALDQLNDLARIAPNFAVVHECLATILLANGDQRGFLAATDRMARIRQNEPMIHTAEQLRAAHEQGPETFNRALIDSGLAEIREGARREHSWPAFLASAVGDRAALVHILKRSDARMEIWGNAGMQAQIAKRWRNDAEIMRLLARRAGPPIA